MKKYFNVIGQQAFSDIGNEKKLNIFCAITGALLGAAAFLIIYGVYPLNVTNDSWLLATYVEDDLSQHYAGWLWFRQSKLTWPLGFAENLAYPVGSSISFTDSIPFVSIFFRLFEPLLPETFQFFGIWILLCFMAQGVSSAMLTGLFIKNRIGIILITSFFVTYPILVERAFRHSALTAQWFILLSLYLYFKQRRENKCFKWQFLLLNFVVVGIHPYFLPFTFGFMLLGAVEHGIRNKKVLLPVEVALLNAAAVVLTCDIVGIFSINASNYHGVERGYGYVSMNLNALFNPTSKSDIVWSSFLPVLPQIKGNYDGFNYLGLGILISLTAFAVLLISKRENILPVIKRNAFLFGFCIFLCIYAVTNTVTFNGIELFTIPIPQKLTDLASTFRSSGRMFYCISYLIILVPFIYLFKRFKKQTVAVVLAILLTIQIIDIYPALKTKHEVFANYAQNGVKSSFDNELWNTATEKYNYVMVMEEPVDNSRLCAYLAKRHTLTNINPSTRMDVDAQLAFVDSVEAMIKSGNYDANTIYIFKTESKMREIAEYIDDEKIMLKYYYYYVLLPTKNGFKIPAEYEQFII